MAELKDCKSRTHILLWLNEQTAYSPANGDEHEPLVRLLDGIPQALAHMERIATERCAEVADYGVERAVRDYGDRHEPAGEMAQEIAEAIRNLIPTETTKENAL